MTKLSEVRNRPATLVLTSRMDARYLAALALYWHKMGENPTSISELIRLSMESFSELLTLNGKTDFPETQEEAMAVLERMSLTVKKINPKNMAQVMMEEGISLESLSSSLEPSRALTTPKVKGKGPVHQVALANLEERMEQELRERVEDSTKRTEEFKKSLGIAPDIKEG